MRHEEAVEGIAVQEREIFTVAAWAAVTSSMMKPVAAKVRKAPTVETWCALAVRACA